MQEIITLHCGIDNCNSHYEYKHNDENIVGICAQWRNEKSNNEDWTGLLPEKPNVGEKYELLIQDALKIDLTQSFWVTYFEPYTEYNGFKSDLGINSMLFCLCRNESVIKVANRMAKLKVEVLKTKKITENNIAKAEYNRITEILNKEIKSQYISVENFDNFSLISANYQSDCGWSYIIEKKNKKSRIVAENQWDFHQDIWKLTNKELNKEQEEKYEIQHRFGDMAAEVVL